MSHSPTSKIAVVQTAPVFLDKQKTVELAVARVEQAAAEGASLVVFTETFIPGYPAWIWRLRPGSDWGASEQLHQWLSRQAVDLSTGDLAPLQESARQHQVTIVCGIEERDTHFSRTTLYNTVVTLGVDGSLLNRRRKLMPTNPERMVWGCGDASGLQVVDTPVGRIGSLICWENFMPLARYTLYSQGIELYIAPTYDSGDDWIGSLRHIAREGGCWVIGCGNLLRGSDIPERFPERETLYPDPNEWINPGDSVVIAPGGAVIAGPMSQRSGILYSEIDLDRITAARRTLDVCGHYARPDIFQLQVNNTPQAPVMYKLAR